MLARHGESEWNRLGIWTGLTDVDLSGRGRMEAQQAGLKLAQCAIDAVYTSPLKRCLSTADEILGVRDDATYIPVIPTPALTEKDYGVFTGKKKFEVRDEVGEEEFRRIRRSWDYQIEGGQSLEQVHAKVAPFHHDTALPRLLDGEDLLVVSHNNTLRAYIKELEDIPPEDMVGVELGTAEVRIYDLDSVGQIIGKTIFTIGDVY
jgi:2,3-bisphosphoglycerate-dependent phosphoglycerate mutase